MNICFFMHFFYIVPEDWNAESTLHFKMKMSEQGCLNTGLFVEDWSPTAVSGDVGLGT